MMTALVLALTMRRLRRRGTRRYRARRRPRFELSSDNYLVAERSGIWPVAASWHRRPRLRLYDGTQSRLRPDVSRAPD